MTSPAQRASDAEREAVADRLRDAAAAGRLDPAELDERLTAAYTARTNAELAPLTADLPAPPPAPPARPSVREHPLVRRQLATFVIANVTCIAIWLATGADGSFWPVWVLLGTGLALGGTLVRLLLGVGDDDDDERRGRAPSR